MIVEERIYTVEIGKTADYFRLYEAEGLEVQVAILGKLIGYFSTEIGPLNQIIHMWGYDSFEERTKRRAALFADERWKSYIAKVRPFIKTQESKILIPAPFSPIR